MVERQRITALEHPPMVGHRYLVPTVVYDYLDGKRRAGPWPVFYPLHNDQQFFAFPWDHYHIDPRFLNAAQRKKLAESSSWRFGDRSPWDRTCATAQSTPLNRTNFAEKRIADHEPVIHYAHRFASHPHPDIIWRELRCYRADIPYMFANMANVVGIQQAFAEQTTKAARTGWVCPHQNVPLGQFAPVDGVITCPLHGLRIRACDGHVLSAQAK